MKTTKTRLRRLIRETASKELAGDFLENDLIDFLIDTGIVRPPSSSTGAATFDEDMDRVYRDAAKFLETFAIPYLRQMAGVIERA
jgi:hypothetical protein